ESLRPITNAIMVHTGVAAKARMPATLEAERPSCPLFIAVSPMPAHYLHLLIGIAVPPPDSTAFVAPFGSPIKPLVNSPKTVEATRVSRVGAIDDTVFKYKRTHARPVAFKGQCVHTAHGREDGFRFLAAALL